MTNEEFQQKVNRFYAQNKPLKLIDVVATDKKHHQCQVCGNRNLKKLCQVRNDERGEEWFVGWNCYKALQTLEEEEEKTRFKEIMECSKCGEESLRGTLLKGARTEGLCNNCWREEHGLAVPVLQEYVLQKGG